MNGAHPRHRATVAAGFATAALVALVACVPVPTAPTLPPQQSEPPRATPSNGTPPTALPTAIVPVGEPSAVTSGLDAPWSVVPRADGTALISQRDTGTIVELRSDGTTSEVFAVPGVVPDGEGGLLGLAELQADDGDWLYAYFTAESDNRIVRMRVNGSPGETTLGSPELVLQGIPRAGNHNGGRIAFGPDGMLYATAGDAGDTDNAQNLDTLAGKILRMTITGGVPGDNPFPGSLIWSYGHRNPQGIAWDAFGRLWASEFGQNTLDELNLIEPGVNYGWPIVEGAGGIAEFRDPVAQWPTGEASPSGIAIVGDTLFMAALRGQRLWAVYPLTASAAGATLTVTPFFVEQFGRLRDVAEGPDGSLWFLSNNTDGRGEPIEGDDRLWQVSLQPVAP